MPHLDLIVQSEIVKGVVAKLKSAAENGLRLSVLDSGDVLSSKNRILLSKKDIESARAAFAEERKTGERNLNSAAKAVMGELMKKGIIGSYEENWDIMVMCRCKGEVQYPVPKPLQNMDHNGFFSESDERRTFKYVHQCKNCGAKMIPVRSFFRFTPDRKDTVKMITSRVKSVSNKLTDMILNYSFDDSIPTNVKMVQDTYGMRVITSSENDCYKFLEMLNEKKIVKPMQVKDYISAPKSNGYQSIHYIGFFNDTMIELQIRSDAMDYVARYGTASHSKRKHKINSERAKTLRWNEFNKAVRLVFDPRYPNPQK